MHLISIFIFQSLYHNIKWNFQITPIKSRFKPTLLVLMNFNALVNKMQ